MSIEKIATFVGVILFIVISSLFIMRIFRTEEKETPLQIIECEPKICKDGANFTLVTTIDTSNGYTLENIGKVFIEVEKRDPEILRRLRTGYYNGKKVRINGYVRSEGWISQNGTTVCNTYLIIKNISLYNGSFELVCR